MGLSRLIVAQNDYPSLCDLQSDCFLQGNTAKSQNLNLEWRNLSSMEIFVEMTA